MNLIENQRAADAPTDIYQSLEEQLMSNIIKHVKDYRKPIDTDTWLLQKLAEIGKLNKENISIIAKAAGDSQEEAERMLMDAAEQALKKTDAGFANLARHGLAGEPIPVEKSSNTKQVIESMTKQAKDALNLCNTTMLYKAQEAYSTLVQNVATQAEKIASDEKFLDTMNKYAASVTIGVESRHQAMIECIRELSEKGIPAFVDKAGRNWTPEAYVNMVLRNTARSTAEEVQTARCKDAGVNLIIIDSHAGARPKCAKDQGKIFSLDNTSGETEDLHGKKIPYYPWNSSSYGDKDGLLGINCGHHKWPFIPGVNVQRYFPTEDMDANNELYKKTQIQRALERDLRKQKRCCMLFNEIEDKEAFEKAAVKLKSKEAKLKAYVKGNKQLHRRKDREQVVGFDKRISAEAIGRAQKHYKEWAKSIGAESGPKTLAGYYDLKYNNNRESRLYKGYVNAVEQGRISPLVGYDVFKKVDVNITKELDGLITPAGVKVNGHTAHFIDRMIGTHVELNDSDNKELKKRLNHASVSIEEAKQAITAGEQGEVVVDSKGRKSQRFIGDKCIVTFNPDTQELIQTNRR